MKLTDEYFMKQALKEAEKAFNADEVPIGALVVAGNQIIGKGHNLTQRLKDPTAHAEILAITAACAHLGTPNLSECVLYVTVEPCTMCFGAIENARIAKIIYGCQEPKTGFSLRLQPSKKAKFSNGILADEAADLLKKFFVNKR